ncbi:MAG: hypothetical protein ACKV22_41435 [Bryobacteraceae bacterium]
MSRFCLALLLVLLPSTVRGAPRRITLNGLEIGLDENTGGILSLRYPKAGSMLEADSASAGLIDLAFPLADYVPMRLATRFSRAVFQEIDHGITITWPELAPSRTHVKLPGGSARVSVTLTEAPDGRSIVMRCRIENRFPQPIPQILFPDFSGLRPMGAPEATRLTMARGSVRPFTQRSENRHHAAMWMVDGNWRVYEATAYSYGPNVMNWLDYGSLQGGFSLFQKKWRDRDYRRPDFLTYVSESRPDRCGWQSGSQAKSRPGKPGRAPSPG